MSPIHPINIKSIGLKPALFFDLFTGRLWTCFEFQIIISKSGFKVSMRNSIKNVRKFEIISKNFENLGRFLQNFAFLKKKESFLKKDHRPVSNEMGFSEK